MQMILSQAHDAFQVTGCGFSCCNTRYTRRPREPLFTLFSISQNKLGFMNPRNFIRYRQPQTVALAHRAQHPVKTFQRLGAFFRCDARTVVHHFQKSSPWLVW